MTSMSHNAPDAGLDARAQLAALLTRLKKGSGRSLRDLEKILPFGRSQLGRILNGIVMPTSQDLLRLLNMFDTSTDDRARAIILWELINHQAIPGQPALPSQEAATMGLHRRTSRKTSTFGRMRGSSISRTRRRSNRSQAFRRSPRRHHPRICGHHLGDRARPSEQLQCGWPSRPCSCSKRRAGGFVRRRVVVAILGSIVIAGLVVGDARAPHAVTRADSGGKIAGMWPDAPTEMRLQNRCGRYEVAAGDLWLRDQYGGTQEQISQGLGVTVTNRHNPSGLRFWRIRTDDGRVGWVDFRFLRLLCD